MAVKIITQEDVAMYMYVTSDYVGLAGGLAPDGKTPVEQDPMWPFHRIDVVDKVCHNGLEFYSLRRRRVADRPNMWQA